MIGLSLCLKQSVGIFGLIAVMQFLSFSNLTGPSQNKKTTPVIALLFLLPFLTVIPFVLIVLHKADNPVNHAYLLCWPIASTAGMAFLLGKRLSRNRASSIGIPVRQVTLLVSGILCGVLPLFLFYVFMQGLNPLLRDTLVLPNQILYGLYSDFDLLKTYLPDFPLRFLRKGIVYLLPLALFTGGAAFTFRKAAQRGLSDSGDRTMMAMSLLGGMLLLTLYPSANQVYILYLLPLILVVMLALLRNLSFRSDLIRHSLSSTFVGAVLLVVAGFLSAAWGEVGARSFEESGGETDFLPFTAHTKPVIAYLRKRPREQELLIYDKYQLFIAFAAGRKTVKDAFPRYLDEMPQDLQRVQSLIDDRQISTVIVGRADSVDRRGNEMPMLVKRNFNNYRMLLTYLQKSYTLTLSTEYYQVFERADSTMHP
jgi:hypothetical protein